MRKIIRAAVNTAALVLACATLSSCGLVVITENFDDRREVSTAGTYTVPGVTAPALPVRGTGREEPDPKSSLDVFPDYDFGGENFIVITAEDSILFGNGVEDKFVRAAENLRAAVAEKFDLRFYPRTPDNTDLGEYIDSMTVGGYYADLMMVPYSEVDALKSAGKITAFNDKAFFIKDSELFDADIMALMNGEDGIYAVYSDSLRDLSDSYCLFFRHDRANKEKLYTAAKEGKLTWDVLISEAGDKGIVCGDGGAAMTERHIPGYEGLIYSEEPCRSFSDGEAAVMIAPISDIEKLSDMKEAFGILPLPKQNADDDYRGYVGGLGSMDVFVCPASPRSAELSVLVLNSFCAAASELFKADALEYYDGYIRDEASYSMLDLIFSPDSIEG